METVTTIFIAVVTAGITSWAAFKFEARKLRREYLLEHQSERVAKQLLSVDRWPLRSFAILRHHIGGFDDDDLRNILVRAGAVRFKSKSGHELWGLLERNSENLSKWKIDQDPETIPDTELYGGKTRSVNVA